MSRLIKDKGLFVLFAEKTASWAGHPAAFLTALTVVLFWAVSGPVFHFSDTWQLVINTGTTIITFLMVFLIQNSQNRDTRAVHIKLDELIRATEGAHTALLDMEELSESELVQLKLKYLKIAAEARKRIRTGGTDMDIPDVILDQ